jgi:pantoate--beta-alanine ligase
MMGKTVRADDGLALSSRNNYLSKEERTIAPGLYKSLSDIYASVQNDPENWQTALDQQGKTLQEKGFRIDYIDIVRYSNLQTPERLEKDEKYIIAGAVFLGETRLIDNILLKLN